MNTLALDVLAVADKYQRQGVGRMIVKWGTALADKLGYMVSSNRIAIEIITTDIAF